jgi:predicted alpha/beta hydrolase family esterase
VAMTRNVLVIHGAGEPLRREGKVYWEPLLQHGLGSAYVVRAPRMPEPEDPNYRDWAERLAELLEQTEVPVLVGHSFGASVILKYLSEVAVRPPLFGVFLAAVPFWGPKFPEFALRADFGARLRDLSPVYLYRSVDDAVIPSEHLERYRKALPHAVVRTLDGRGHEFDQPDFPELVADIRGLEG